MPSGYSQWEFVSKCLLALIKCCIIKLKGNIYNVYKKGKKQILKFLKCADSFLSFDGKMI